MFMAWAKAADPLGSVLLWAAYPQPRSKGKMMSADIAFPYL